MLVVTTYFISNFIVILISLALYIGGKEKGGYEGARKGLGGEIHMTQVPVACGEG